MPIGATNISMSAIAAEVLESQTNFSFANEFSGTGPARALVDKPTSNSQISFSDFANRTASLGYIALYNNNSVNLNVVEFIRTIRNSSMTRNYPYFYIYGTNPSFQVSNVNAGFAMTNDGNYYVHASGTNTIFELWQRSGSNWTKVSTLTDAAISGIYMSWDPTGTYLIATGAGGSSPMAILKRTGNTLSKIYTAPVVVSQGYGPVMWNPTGTIAHVFGFANTTSARSVFRYSRSGDTFTALAALGTPLGVDVYTEDAAFKPDGTQLVVCFVDSSLNNRTFVYTISGTTYTKVATNPTALSSGAINRINFSPDGVYAISSDINKVYGYSVSGTTYTLLSSSVGEGANTLWCDGTIYAQGIINSNNQNLNQFTVGNPPTLLSSYFLPDVLFPGTAGDFSASHRSVAGSKS